MSKRLVIVAGGTGGHLYPGVAVARALVKAGQDWEPVFIVRQGDLGKTLITKEGFPVYELAGQGLPRGLSPKLVTFTKNLCTGFGQAWSLLRELKPQAVMGMGGYLSFPALLAASLQRLPTLIHEQNVFPGLANRVLGRFVRSVAVSFSESGKAFPRGKVWVSGLPVRAEIGSLPAEAGKAHFNLPKNRLTFLIFGGSLGAHRINEAAVNAWPLLAEQYGAFQILHVTGESDYDRIKAMYAQIGVNAVVLPYCHEMAYALAAADGVICRAGASTVAELILAQRPALLIPFPFASENHQYYNAKMLADRGAAELIPEANVSPQSVADWIGRCLRDPGLLYAARKSLGEMAQVAPHGSAANRLAGFLATFS